MLDGAGDDVIAFFAIHLGRALDGQIVALRGARGENDLIRAGVDQPGDTGAALIDPLLGLPSIGVVAAGGVTEFFGEIR